MKKALMLVSVVVAICMLAPAVWAESPELDELQALRKELMELKNLVIEQQKQIQEQEMKMMDLEESWIEPTPYADTSGGMHVEEIVERVKAELAPRGDGFTLGGGKIQVTPYGFIRLDMAYDDSPVVHSSGNIVAAVLPEDFALWKDDDESFTTTATATRLGLNFDGPKFANGKIRGKIEIDFDEAAGGDFGGDVTAHRIRMRQAYAELVYPTWSLLAGQSWDIVAPRVPYMLDCMVMWGAGNVGYRRAQLRLTKTWDNDGCKITGQASLNHADRNITGSNFDPEWDFGGTVVSEQQLLNGVESGWPMLEARLGVDTKIFDDRALSLGISGLVAENEVDHPVPMTKEDLNVWMVALDGKVTVIPGLLTLQGEIWTGENLNVVYGNIMQGIVVDPDNSDKLEEVEGSGGFVHAMLTPRKDLKLNCGYGLDDVDSDNLGTGGKSLNWVVFGNAIHSVTPNFDIGLEVAWHETKYVNRKDGDDLRIQGAFIYKF